MYLCDPVWAGQFKDCLATQYPHDLLDQRVDHRIVVFFDEDFLCGKADGDELHVKEGILILTDTTHPYPGTAMFKMLWRMARALGFKNFSNIIKKFKAGGASLEKTYRDSKNQFVQIELLAVKKEHQGKGFMRPLAETAFEVAKQGNLPVIVSTDAKLKKDKYEHIGMKHINTRTLGEKSFMYDLVKEI